VLVNVNVPENVGIFIPGTLTFTFTSTFTRYIPEIALHPSRKNKARRTGYEDEAEDPNNPV
jgi:hypothetical protein